MAKAAELAIVVRAKDDASPMLKGLQGRLEATAQKAAAVGKGMALIGGVMMAGVGFALKAATDYGKVYTQIAAGTGATGKQLEGLKAVFKSVAASVSSDSGMVAGIIMELNTRLGLTGGALKEVTTNIAEVARMMGVDGVAATIALSKAMDVWGVQASEAPGFLDKMFVASQKTGVGIVQLNTLMSEYGAVLKNAGYTSVEAIAFFAKLEGAGVSVTRIMPGLNAAIRNFAKEGVNLKSGLEDTITQIRRAGSTSEALAIATGVFGAEGAARLTDAIRAGKLELKDFEVLLDASTGAVTKFSEATKDPAARLGELKNQVMVLAASLGETLIPTLEPLIEKFAAVIEKVVAWVQANPALAGTIVKIVAALGGLMLVFGLVLVALPFLISGFFALGTAVTFAMGPIGIIILGVVAAVMMLVGAGLLLQRNWGAISTAVSGFFARIGEAAASAMDWVKSAIEGTVDWVMSLVEWIKQLWEMIQQFLGLRPKAGKPRPGEKYAVTAAEKATAAYYRGEYGGPVYAYQHGGVVRHPTLALVGEKGPEAIVPLGRGQAPGGITINIEGDVLVRDDSDIDRLAAKISESIGLSMTQRQRMRA